MAEYKGKLFSLATKSSTEIMLYETTETISLTAGRNIVTPTVPTVAGYTVVGLISAQANTGATILCDGVRNNSVRIWNFDNSPYASIGFHYTWLLIKE